MWSPKEVRGLIAQIAGVLFGLGGIALMIVGVKATGKINISSSLLSGEIESGSAGLLMLFLSFFLIAIPGIVGKVTSKDPVRRNASDRGNKGMSANVKEIVVGSAILIFGVILTFSCFIGGQSLSEQYHLQIGGFLVFAGYVFGVLTILFILAFIYAILSQFDSSIGQLNEGTQTVIETKEKK